jgi:glutathione-regulated potassium-efflux system ancillary protein KefC/glutathione-regulated potassium-efflux system protein KefB
MLVVKGLAAFAVGRAGGLDSRQSLSLAAALAGGGEFAFVLLAVAARGRLVDASTVDLAVLVVALSMAVTPLVMTLAGRMAPRAPAEHRPFDAIEPADPQVVIAGFGRYGQIVGRILRARRIPFTALEASPAQVDFVRRFGNRLYYGDATRPELLEAARVGQARVFVIAVDDVEASVRIAETVRRRYPQVRVLARARNRAHAFRLMELGVQHVMRETLLSSLETSQHVLEALGLGVAEARSTVRTFRIHDEQVLARQSEHHGDEAKLVQTSQEAARELERLFESDRTGPAPPA